MFHKLKQINDDVCYSGSSAMVESQALVGRPHGGTAILWRSNIGFKVTPISCESVRLSSVMLNINSLVSFLIVNVYMPCDERRTGDNLNEYLEILQEISCLIVASLARSEYVRSESEVRIILLGERCTFSGQEGRHL